MINQKPEVGRYVFAEPTHADSFVSTVARGRVVRIAGQRIVYTEDVPGGRERFMYRVAAVCDTNEEVEKILYFNRRAIERTVALRVELTNEFNNLEA